MVATPIGTSPGLDRYANLAGRLTRLLAAIVDGILFGLLVAGSRAGNEPGLAGLLLLILIVLQVILLGRDGQTIGKKLFAVRIVDVDTRQQAGFFKTVVLRAFLNALLSLIPFYGLIDALLIFREDRRCLHDLIAGTVVVRA